jgi:cell division protein FtsI (penicillin-binding protein 3)
VASFVGVVPASAPRLLILVMVDEPRGQIFGGLVAAPAFEQIARFDLQYLEVPPDNLSTLHSDAASTVATTAPPVTTTPSTTTTPSAGTAANR